MRNGRPDVFEILQEVGNSLPLTLGKDVFVQSIAGFP